MASLTSSQPSRMERPIDSDQASREHRPWYRRVPRGTLLPIGITIPVVIYVLLFLTQDYNTRMVLWGTGLLGGAAGAVSLFMLLRKRALLGDVVSHASLPGIALAYLVMEVAWPGEGKSLLGLLTGGTLGGIVGVLSTTAIRRWTRIHDDAALAIVLSVFFGFGISLLTVIQRLPGGNAAGLSSFIYGKAAAMTAGDVQAIALVAAIVGGACLILLKELTLLCFDDRYAAVQGWPTLTLDLLLMGLVVTVTVIGLQSVGLLLVVALLIIPAASARFWTDRLGLLLLLAILTGMTMSLLGVFVSSLVPRVATGAVIVLSGTTLFILSLLLGTRRGLLRRALQRRQSRHRAQREHLLRGMYELLEKRKYSSRSPHEQQAFQDQLDLQELAPLRSWSESRLKRLVAEAERRGWLTRSGQGVRFTRVGLAEARRLVRNHRLWELYLIQHADTAPAHVDRSADRIEHLLDADLLAELEAKLADDFQEVDLPESPHGV